MRWLFISGIMAAKPLPEWRIVLIRKKAEYLDRVNARTADEAIKVAIKDFEITDAERQIDAIVAWSPAYQHWEAIIVMLVPVLRQSSAVPHFSPRS